MEAEDDDVQTRKLFLIGRIVIVLCTDVHAYQPGKARSSGRCGTSRRGLAPAGGGEQCEHQYPCHQIEQQPTPGASVDETTLP